MTGLCGAADVAGVVWWLPTYDPVMGARRRWNDLRPRTRRVIVVVATIEGLLKIAALVDIARRDHKEVRGPRARWAAAVGLINSLGAVPVAYFVWGRRRSAA